MTDSARNYKYILIFQLLGIILLAIKINAADISLRTITAIASVLFVGFINVFVGRRLIGYSRHYMIVTMIFTIGTIEIFRLNTEYALKQMFWFILGIMLMYVTYLTVLRFKFYKKWYWLYSLAIYFLFFVTLAFGIVRSGAKNWVSIANHLFQPVELIKILYIFQLASLHDSRPKVKHIEWINMLITFSYLGLLMLQRDLGSAAVIFCIYIVYLFILARDKRRFFATIFLFILFGVIGYHLLGHVRVRFDAWLHPLANYRDRSYQIVRGLTAMATGSFFGTGLGLGLPNIIPVNISDMIFACIVEEMGIFMGIAIVLLYLIFSVDSLLLSTHIGDVFKQDIAVMISAFYIIQFFIILLGTLNLIPLTGLTAPFLSYGGSSMLSSFMMLGALQASHRSIS